jgi:hypothetical protein
MPLKGAWDIKVFKNFIEYLNSMTSLKTVEDCFDIIIEDIKWPVYQLSEACLHGKTPPRLGHVALASEVTGGLPFPF